MNCAVSIAVVAHSVDSELALPRQNSGRAGGQKKVKGNENL